MRVFIYSDVEKINIKAMNYRAWGMCVTSNVLVIFISLRYLILFLARSLYCVSN